MKRFKHGHSSGDLVEGVFIRLEPAAPGTAWVNLDGAVLLATLPDELSGLARKIASSHGVGAMPNGLGEADFPIQNGQTCYFILESIEPEPLLRMLSVTATPGLPNPEVKAVLMEEQKKARWRSIISLPLTQLAARYTQQRSQLESLLQRQLWTEADKSVDFPRSLPESLTDFSASAFASFEIEDFDSSQARYRAFINDTDEASSTFSELELYRAALVENLQPYGLLGFFFVPWLCPAARSLELAFYRQRTTENTKLDRASTMQGVSFLLQGLYEDGGRQYRRELSGPLYGKNPRLREPNPDEPDLLRFILSIRPEETRPSFSRKA